MFITFPKHLQFWIARLFLSNVLHGRTKSLKAMIIKRAASMKLVTKFMMLFTGSYYHRTGI